MQSNNKKICIVASSLGKGGAQRASAQLSIMLHNLGYDVHIVTVLNQVDFKYKGTLLNLGALKDEKDTVFGRIERLKYFRNYLKQHQFDVIIDGRARVQAYRELLITKWVYSGVQVIYVLHNYKTSKTFTSNSWLNSYLYTHEKMVTVSDAARLNFQEKFHLKDVETIYNGFDFEQLIKSSNEVIAPELSKENYILFFGRLDNDHKNIILLLDAYNASDLASQNIKLLLVGDGPDLRLIQDHVSKLELEAYVVFKGFTANPYPYVKHARFTMLTSRYEGFPMVIPESLGLGTPIISVDCKSGPNEVIISGFNGLLVENFNVDAISQAMNSFITDDILYQTCKSNTQDSVRRFSVKNITNNWKKLLDKM